MKTMKTTNQDTVRTIMDEKVKAMRLTNIEAQTGIPKDTLSKFMRGQKDLWPEHLAALNDYLEKH